MKIIKNGNQETKLAQTSMVFTSGQYKQTEGTTAKKMIDSQKGGKKEALIKNDLQERVLPKIPLDYLNMQASPILD
jgi:hypothetical protein